MSANPHLDGYEAYLGRYIDHCVHPAKHTALVFDKEGNVIAGAASDQPFPSEFLQQFCDSAPEGTMAESYRPVHWSPRRLPIFGERDVDRALREALCDSEFACWVFRGSGVQRHSVLFWYLDRYENPLAMSIDECERHFDTALKEAEDDAADDEDDGSALAEHEEIYPRFEKLRDAWLARRVGEILGRRVVSLELPHACADLEDIEPPELPGVYCVQGVGDFVKIGKASKSIRQRVREIQIAHPVRLRLRAILSSNPDDERALHQRFARLRAEGEWFRLEGTLLALIREVRGVT